MIYIEIAIVVVLICVNGLLSMSELAIVSSRPARLKAMIDRGVKGATTALELGSDPGKFLSSVQIGITLVGILSGAFSGATLGNRLAAFLAANGVSQSIADPGGVGVVVAVITYFSLIAGELVPKQVALRNPERVAAKAAPAMAILARIAAPLVFLLDVSAQGLLWLLGYSKGGEEKVTDDEIKMLVAEAEHHGTIESDERRMIAGVMRHGYKGGAEMAATVDFLFAYAATTGMVGNNHFEAIYDAYVMDEAVRDFLEEKNPHALEDIKAKLTEAMDHGLWTPRSNSARFSLQPSRQSANPVS